MGPFECPSCLVEPLRVSDIDRHLGELGMPELLPSVPGDLTYIFTESRVGFRMPRMEA